MKVLSLTFLVVFVSLTVPNAAHSAVVINEFMYNSPGTPDVEWIELHNNGPLAVELDDFYLIDDDPLHPHCLLVGDLPAGGYLVVPADFATFSAQYPAVTNLNINAFDPAGTGFGLSNSGETIYLYNDDGILVDSVTYDDGLTWPGSADGDGPSLELVNASLDNNNPTAWDPSLVIGGTPGQINSVYTDNQAPIIHDTDRAPVLPQGGDQVLITALVSDATDLDRVELFVDLGTGFISRPMFDDGAHGDGAPADSLFAATIEIQPEDTVVRYYVAAYDDFGSLVTKPSTAPVKFHAYTVGYNPVYTLRVNEVMANNGISMYDEFGEFDDWVEIHNFSSGPVDLEGMYLTDDIGEHRKWILPSVVIPANDYLIVWCDNQPEQGPLHTTFALSAGGEAIALYDTEEHGNTLWSGFQFGIQNVDVPVGYYDQVVSLPGLDKTTYGVTVEPEYLSSPTPGALNESEPLAAVVINEFQTTSSSGGVDDWIEFHNRSNVSMNIGGWGVSDNLANPLKWVFPANTWLDADGYLVVNEVELGFSLSSAGEVIQLSDATGLFAIDFIAFGPQQPDVSYGRHPMFLNDSFWAYNDAPTPGAPNPNYLSPVGEGSLPAAMRVTGVHPNPFNPTTKIHFELPRDARVAVDIYSLDGRLVRSIDGGLMPAGTANVTFNGLDNHGRPLASGVFFARVRAGADVAVVKMMMVK
jgi:Lamin Tail Domain/FlgD Ig-like domain